MNWPVYFVAPNKVITEKTHDWKKMTEIRAFILKIVSKWRFI